MKANNLLPWSLAGLLLALAGPSALATQMGPGVVSVPEKLPQRSAPVLATGGGSLPTLRLPELLPSRLAGLTEAGGPRQVGLGRQVPKGALQTLDWGNPAWQQLDDGRQLAALAVESPGALALRLGLRVERLPASALLRFGAEPETGIEPVEVGASEVLAAVAANQAADPEDPNADIYWSPVVTGERVILELELPEGADPSQVKLEIAEVSHLYEGEISKGGLYEPRAGACNNDISCYASATIDHGTAVARMLFTKNGGTFVCTGTLLNDANPSADFYFLTANHCIASQTVASTLQNYWYYRSASCNSASQNPAAVNHTGGATMLVNLGGSYDSTLLRLNQAPPNGISMSGWQASVPGSGSSLFGVHHPGGDWKKISFGNRDVIADCSEDGEFYFCAPNSNGHFFAVGWSDGVTEAGSSGSGIFTSGDRYLVGNLSSGGSDCNNPNELDFYASFADAYSAGNLGQWLMDSGQSPPPSTSPDIAKNLSTRGYITPNFPMHGGIVVSGNPRVLITARGPSSGLATALADTTMDLYKINPGQPANLIMQNDDWGTNANASEIASLTSTRPLSQREAALLTNLSTGSYTAVTRDFGNNNSGEALLGFTLVADSGGIARNLSTRGYVTPNFPMHGGIVVQGIVDVLITARGPSTGLTSALADTTMQLYKVSSGQPPVALEYNDDWGSNNSNSSEIASLTSNRPLSQLESAILVTLSTGSYTAVVKDYQTNDSGEVVLGFTVIE